MMTVATFNVNSLRKRLPIVVSWLKKNRPDVLCLQETKVRDEEFPLQDLTSLGYHVTFRGMKAYNGVATLTLKKPTRVVYGLWEGPDADDFRIIQVVVDGVAIINTYVPQGYMTNSPKFAYKLRWYENLRDYFDRHLTPKTPAIWTGDLNVAPEPIDVYAPERMMNEPCFHPKIREAYKNTVGWGFIDVFRKLYPEKQQFTFWDFFRDHFAKNSGWRIDHILATAPLAEKCVESGVDLEPRKAPVASDHTAVWAKFDI